MLSGKKKQQKKQQHYDTHTHNIKHRLKQRKGTSHLEDKPDDVSVVLKGHYADFWKKFNLRIHIFFW